MTHFLVPYDSSSCNSHLHSLSLGLFTLFTFFFKRGEMKLGDRWNKS